MSPDRAVNSVASHSTVCQFCARAPRRKSGEARRGRERRAGARRISSKGVGGEEVVVAVCDTIV